MTLAFGLHPGQVGIYDARHQCHQIRLLPIRCIEQVEAITRRMAENPRPRNCRRDLRQLRRMLAGALPRTLRRLLPQLDYPALIQLALVMIYGEEALSCPPTTPRRDTGKLDLHFARIMAVFPQYRFDDLMACDSAQIRTLAALAVRIGADQALGVIASGVAAALHGGNAFQELERLRDGESNAAEKKPVSEAQIQEALARLQTDSPQQQVRTQVTVEKRQ